ncbi:MAG: S8 family serine peptidase [Phycisphaerales bacterium]
MHVNVVLAGVLAMGIGGAALGDDAHDPGDLQPRTPLAKMALAGRPAFEHRLTVKFVDAVRARADANGGLVSAGGVDVQPLLDALAGAGDGPVAFRPLIDMPMAELEAMLADAANRSGRAQPDLGGIMVVGVADANMDAVARVLHESDLTEYVYYQQLNPTPPGWFEDGPDDGPPDGPPDGPTDGPDACVDIAPATGDYFGRQGYHGEGFGIHMAAAWDVPGGRGQGVNVADCEYWFDGDHEDLCNVISEPGQTPDPDVIAFGWDEHGTAVLGEMVGGDNGYGVTGLVPDAQAYFFPEWTVEGGSRRVAAISRAIGAMDAGDVVLLEMQTFGPGGDFAPAELDPSVWLVTGVGTDRGVTVVAAAGNGDQDLDSAPYAEYRGRGDSGAIIVGAGRSTGSRSKMSFSTFGSRVNVQAWGENVFTTGYGDFIVVGGDARQSYTQRFAGTSSASPIVASAVVSLQGIHRAATGEPMDPLDVRQLVMDTGRPQGSGGQIGPLPDMAAAVDALLAGLCRADFDGDGGLTLFDFLAYQTAFDAGEARADFDGDGSLTIFDFLAFQTAFDAGCG